MATKTKKQYSYFERNGLSIVMIFFFLFFWIAQSFSGFLEYNKFLKEEGQSVVSYAHYLTSGHFWQATFENWESEFLQMGLFVWFTIFLKQKGSAESNSMEDAEPKVGPVTKRSPWPVRKGGFILKIYEHSLSLSLLILFVFSFLGHWMFSLKFHNLEQALKHQPTAGMFEYLTQSTLWFESFQNWQSEFLAVFAICVLSVYLREKGSAQSKPVAMPHDENE